jgi:hypothetical protein
VMRQAAHVPVVQTGRKAQQPAADA